VTFNIGFFPLFFPLFSKISVKGWAAQLKMKMAKKLKKNFRALKFQPLEIGSQIASDHLQEFVRKVYASFNGLLLQNRQFQMGSIGPNSQSFMAAHVIEKTK